MRTDDRVIRSRLLTDDRHVADSHVQEGLMCIQGDLWCREENMGESLLTGKPEMCPDMLR
ncbi:hypothetical protein JYU34_012498 [Plutella xylostella]|uniref:Uncharacterized protein n=1 Tax=Plutella xylostella TaxID=51655 RepID=A0ABQ7QCT4_PLUXY|nr:hypothetical protein JYU34_012498 [Plutella xylostella]